MSEKIINSKRKLKTIFLFDLITSGHHPTFIVSYTKAFVSLGYKVVIVYPNPDEIINLLNKIDDINLEQISFYKSINYFSTLSNNIRYKTIVLWISTAINIIKARIFL